MSWFLFYDSCYIISVDSQYMKTMKLEKKMSFVIVQTIYEKQIISCVFLYDYFRIVRNTFCELGISLEHTLHVS